MISTLKKLKFVFNYKKLLKNSYGGIIDDKLEDKLKNQLNYLKKDKIISDDFYLDILANVTILSNIVKCDGDWVNFSIENGNTKLYHKISSLIDNLDANKYVTTRVKSIGGHQGFQIIHQEKIIKYLTKKTENRINEITPLTGFVKLLSFILPNKTELKSIIYAIITAIIIAYLTIKFNIG